MTFLIRPYQSSDYEGVASLYRQSDLYGGQFDEGRDSPSRLDAQIENFFEAILVAVDSNNIIGTVSLVDDGRVAWLFRFAVDRTTNEDEVARSLHAKATEILSKRGHAQVLVYAPADDGRLAERYSNLGMNRGSNYTCYWSKITG